MSDFDHSLEITNIQVVEPEDGNPHLTLMCSAVKRGPLPLPPDGEFDLGLSIDRVRRKAMAVQAAESILEYLEPTPEQQILQALLRIEDELNSS